MTPRLPCSPHALSLLCLLALPTACGDDSSANADSTGSSSTGPSSSSSGAGTDASAGSEGTTVQADTTAGTSQGATSMAETGSDTATEVTTAADATSSSSSAEATTNPGGSTDTGASLECPSGSVDAVPQTQFGNTFGQLDDFSGSCGGSGSPDQEFTFTAPAAGVYTFDTHGSQLDSVLYVLDGTCGGAELGCNDNGDGVQSALTLTLAAGQDVTIVVDGHGGLGEPFNLRVRAGAYSCPIEHLDASPAAVAGNTAALFAGSSGSCGGAGGQEAAYVFTPPTTGTYTFDTFGSSFPSILYVRNGTCTGAEIVCGSQGVLADLVAGQDVTVVVDSTFANGPFELHIDTLGGACPDEDLGSSLPQSLSGNTGTSDNTSSGSCGGDFSPDDVYLFTAPQAGLYQFDTFGSELDTVLYLQDGGCGGPELRCNDDVAPGNTDSRVIAGLAADQTVAVAVDGNGFGAYDLNIAAVPCPDESAPGVSPQALSGSTSGGLDKLDGSCGAGLADASPDHAYAFTAPETAVYAFDTFGSSFDTRLYVLDGPACNAPELACNDNYQFNSTSALSVPLVAGQTVVVVVDGNFGSSGAYDLNIATLDGACPDEDLGNVLPLSVSGTTAAADNAGAGSCGGLTGVDYSYTWTAPADATYRFDTSGSAFSTVLYVRDGSCGGAELACNAPGFGTSLVFAELVTDQTVVITIDGEGVSGAFDLNIEEAPAGGDCCEPHMYTGCGVPEIEDCVCGLDPFCCSSQWDSICAGEAVDDCGAGCV